MQFNGRALIFTFCRTQVRIAEIERLQSVFKMSMVRCVSLDDLRCTLCSGFSLSSVLAVRSVYAVFLFQPAISVGSPFSVRSVPVSACHQCWQSVQCMLCSCFSLSSVLAVRSVYAVFLFQPAISVGSPFSVCSVPVSACHQCWQSVLAAYGRCATTRRRRRRCDGRLHQRDRRY